MLTKFITGMLGVDESLLGENRVGNVELGIVLAPLNHTCENLFCRSDTIHIFTE